MSNKLFHMISFPLQLLLYPPLHSKNHQDTPAFFLKFSDHPLESPLLPAALACPTANIQGAAAKLPSTQVLQAHQTSMLNFQNAEWAPLFHQN